MGGSASCTHPLHAEGSEHKLFTVFTSTVPHQTKANTTGGSSPWEEAREAVSVCVFVESKDIKYIENFLSYIISEFIEQQLHELILM